MELFSRWRKWLLYAQVMSYCVYDTSNIRDIRYMNDNNQICRQLGRSMPSSSRMALICLHMIDLSYFERGICNKATYS